MEKYIGKMFLEPGSNIKVGLAEGIATWLNEHPEYELHKVIGFMNSTEYNYTVAYILFKLTEPEE